MVSKPASGKESTRKAGRLATFFYSRSPCWYVVSLLRPDFLHNRLSAICEVTKYVFLTSMQMLWQLLSLVPFLFLLRPKGTVAVWGYIGQGLPFTVLIAFLWDLNMLIGFPHYPLRF